MSTEKILFYVKDLDDNSIWSIHEIDTNERNRLGWLNCKCVDIGNDSKNYIGADMGIDAEWVYTSEKFDVSKQLSTLQTPQQ